MVWLTDGPCVVYRETLAFCNFFVDVVQKESDLTLLQYWSTKEDVQATYWYKMFPRARISFPSPKFIFLHDIIRYLIFFLALFPVWLERRNGLDSRFEFRGCKLSCGTWWWKYYLGKSTMPNLSQTRKQEVTQSTGPSLLFAVQGRNPSQLLGRSADAASPHKYTLPGLLCGTAAFH